MNQQRIIGRTRSEHRLQQHPDDRATDTRGAPNLSVRRVNKADRLSAAALLLDAYRGTPDDFGEGEAEALQAIDLYFTAMERQHSFAIHDGDQLIAMSLVVVVDELHFIDPVVTVSSRKREGLGEMVVRASLRSLAADGLMHVGAVITDGNVAPERLFAKLGFTRHGDWS